MAERKTGIKKIKIKNPLSSKETVLPGEFTDEQIERAIQETNSEPVLATPLERTTQFFAKPIDATTQSFLPLLTKESTLDETKPLNRTTMAIREKEYDTIPIILPKPTRETAEEILARRTERSSLVESLFGTFTHIRDAARAQWHAENSELNDFKSRKTYSTQQIALQEKIAGNLLYELLTTIDARFAKHEVTLLCFNNPLAADDIGKYVVHYAVGDALLVKVADSRNTQKTHDATIRVIGPHMEYFAGQTMNAGKMQTELEIKDAEKQFTLPMMSIPLELPLDIVKNTNKIGVFVTTTFKNDPDYRRDLRDIYALTIDHAIEIYADVYRTMRG